MNSRIFTSYKSILLAKTKRRNTEALPIRSTSQIKEDDSKGVFTNLIKPWMVVSWIEKDYGIDATIEITKPIATSGNQIVTGKRVSVQLKSSTKNKFNKKTFSLSVEKKKINYWMQSFEPVILVYIDLNTSIAYYRWIDESLIQELYERDGDWIAHDSVSIKFDKTLQVDAKSLNKIERYVLAWKRPARTLLTPGNYFNFSNDAHEYAKKLIELCNKYDVQALRNELKDLSKSVSSSIYTIAIIGLSRGGKSTLINALLERDISPMGKLPTTGVPITIFPKDENRAFVTLKEKNKVIEGDASSDFLAEYSAQDKNPRNEKGVKHVRVHVINTLLERGFALCDVPGLDDADPEIKSVAKTAILQSNAIIYVISLAGYQDGEFRINDKNISDLNNLRGKMDRVFLVFNKADKLSKDDLKEVTEYINRTLEQFDILNFLAAPPIFISSLEAFERRTKRNGGSDSVSYLEQVLWEYLINQNRTGLHKIISNFANELDLIKKLKTLSQIRLDHTVKRESLQDEVRKVKDEMKELQSFIISERKDIYNQANNYVIDRFENVINHARVELEGITNKNNLPTPQQVTNFLENEAYKVLSDVYEFIQQKSYILQADVNDWVGEKLEQVELSLDDVNKNAKFQLPDINAYLGHVYSFFNNSNGRGVGILEDIFSGIGQAMEWLFNIISDLFIEERKILKREINKILNNSRKSYNKIQVQLLQNVSNYLNGISQEMFEKTKDRVNVYLGELSKEVRKLDTPLSDRERENHIQFIKELESIEREILSQFNHLKDYTEGIDVFKMEKNN